FIDDLVEAIKLSATVEGVGGEVFQIATSTETTVRELIDELLAVLATVGIKDVPVSQTIPRQGDVQRNYSDTSKAENMLGWKARVALPDGLKRTVDWFEEQPA
nr:GDP-mannose 4,6-dehydratase [Actinomycetota bacterium]